MRISYIVQVVAFTAAIITPQIAVFVEWQAGFYYIVAYSWIVGIIAALWNRAMIEDNT